MASSLARIGEGDLALGETVKLATLEGKPSHVGALHGRALQMLPEMVDAGGDRKKALDVLLRAMDKGETLGAAPALAKLGGDRARDALLKRRGKHDRPESGAVSRDAIIRKLLRSHWPDDPKVRELLGGGKK